MEVPKTSALHNQNSLLHSARQQTIWVGKLLRGVIGSTTVSGTVSWGSSPYGVIYCHEVITRPSRNLAFFGGLVVYGLIVSVSTRFRCPSYTHLNPFERRCSRGVGVFSNSTIPNSTRARHAVSGLQIYFRPVFPNPGLSFQEVGGTLSTWFQHAIE